jgi:hypothetical protein
MAARIDAPTLTSADDSEVTTLQIRSQRKKPINACQEANRNYSHKTLQLE